MSKTITLPAQLENIPAITDFVSGALEEADCSPKAMVQIEIALDEILSNVCHYAYKGAETGDMTVEITVTDEVIARIVFIDNGVPYDPLAKDDPDISLSADEREVGGLGIFMVKKTMDGMEYERRDNCNILTVTKKI